MEWILKLIIANTKNKYVDITNLSILEQADNVFKVKYKIVHVIKDISAALVPWTTATITIGGVVENETTI